ncbi:MULTISPECIES: glycosyltransferase family 4 protein [unclassified Rathayibacter]|uniref:glycosyltransferase family 4 protein n=1 Tax=unclassified Rathayibacter TaxID=2609250 RepID=UPI00188AD1AD|nr:MULTISPECIES: glycosyltransferase family 4 protein [unclassified Rathayibacter]MBF4461883.1 glycosyltransferase family 4 protein [Rathayibacter sp. VKM Ac-2879]MBF4504074.1 glycosyltransferase family 4 protein [Rathayibacter sp. VKM Ac-2878]
MRILHLTDTMTNSANGINNVVVDLATWQSDAGHSVVVGSAGGDFEPLLARHRVATTRLDFGRRSPAALPALLRRLRRIIGEAAPDVIHAHTLTPALLAAAVAPRTPRVATVHNEFQRGVGVMGLSHAVVCVSRANERVFSRRPLARGRTITITNAPLGSPRRSDPVHPERLLGVPILAVGSITRRKGSDLLVRAFGCIAETHPDAHLYFVGNLDEPEVLEAAIGMPWGERIHLVGAVADPRPYLLGARIAVAASRREPFGLVVIEEREAGLACVVSSADGLPEVADFGAAAQIVPVGDVERLASALGALLDDKAVLAEWSERARRGLEAFDVSRMNEDYLRLYSSMLRR